jgi:hypothetical protein
VHDVYLFVVMSRDETDDKGRALYWSNDDGWTPIEHATRFTQDERRNVCLPVGGKWTGLSQEDN